MESEKYNPHKECERLEKRYLLRNINYQRLMLAYRAALIDACNGNKDLMKEKLEPHLDRLC